MKISQLMRMGAAVTKQTVGEMCNTDKTATCALGAILVGAYKTDEMHKSSFNEVEKTMGREVYYKPVVLPPSSREGGKTRALYSAIYQLNDIDGWTREKIADWLEGMGL